ncbi:MAG: hypothetical protein K2N26_04300, partial [Oscillospiraceae bacterium]|nr:hypothetical protein [Oscillospiraceae bacterium]
MAERCPICGEEIILGACQGCGFEAPDLSAIAAPYDLDPSNDHFGESDSLEGMFPAGMTEITDLGNGYFEESSELEIPSIALPNLQSVGSLGFASAKAKPAPKIVVMRSNPLPGSSQPFPKQVNRSAASGRQTVQPQTAKTVQSMQNAQIAQSAPFVPYVQQVQQMQQASLPVRIVKG